MADRSLFVQRTEGDQEKAHGESNSSGRIGQPRKGAGNRPVLPVLQLYERQRHELRRVLARPIE